MPQVARWIARQGSRAFLECCSQRCGLSGVRSGRYPRYVAPTAAQPGRKRDGWGHRGDTGNRRRPCQGGNLVAGELRRDGVGLSAALLGLFLEGPLSPIRFWAEIDQATQKLIAYHGHINQEEQEMTIWMDGRPHPPDAALHTWSGFSTGEWDGDTLVVTTTHLKETYIRRDGLMHSDRATIRTRWRRMGDYLQATSILYDPVYMTEPYVRSTMMWVSDPNMRMDPYPCEEATETAIPRGAVPTLSSWKECPAGVGQRADGSFWHPL